jgi:hypothetical protein
MTFFSELMASQNSMEQETPSHSITKFVLATSSSYQPAPPPTRYIWWCGHLANRCSHTASRSPSGLPTAFFAVHQLQRTANLFAVHPINGVPQNGVPQMPDCRAIRCRTVFTMCRGKIRTTMSLPCVFRLLLSVQLYRRTSWLPQNCLSRNVGTDILLWDFHSQYTTKSKCIE